MSAGQREDHNIQDDAEIYFTYRMQKLSENNGISARRSSENLHEHLIRSLEAHNVSEEKFLSSNYAKAVDLTVDEVHMTIRNHYQGKTLDFICVETEYRNLNKKGDFVILLDGEEEISVSLKNYKKLSDIQTCSGTFFSFLNNFLLKKAGVGKYYYPTTNEVFKSNNQMLWSALEIVGNSKIVEHQRYMNEILNTIRTKYLNSDKYKIYNKSTSTEWVNDCFQFGHLAVNSAIEALSTLPNDLVRDRFLHMSGLDHEEELLIISHEGEFMFSVTHEKYQTLVSECRKPNVTVSYRKKKKSLFITLIGESGNELISIDIPFTLQKNGAWHCPKKVYEGTQYHVKEDMNLLWGQMRPRKSRELNTSTNCWLRIKKVLV